MVQRDRKGTWRVAFGGPVEQRGTSALVLGLLSVGAWVVAGIPACVVAVQVLQECERGHPQRRPAILGLILGVVTTIVGAVLLLMPSVESLPR